VIRPSTVPGLYVLPGGSEPANISRLLHSTNLDSLIEMARAEYDFVLIDSPPMMGMADARLLSRNADGVILISRAGETSPEQLGEARERLADDGTQSLGQSLTAAIFVSKTRHTSTTTTAMQVQHAISDTSNRKLDYDHLIRKQTVCAGSPAAIHCCKKPTANDREHDTRERSQSNESF
jgi:Mrp family chromosome partitioning ATPase